MAAVSFYMRLRILPDINIKTKQHRVAERIAHNSGYGASYMCLAPATGLAPKIGQIRIHLCKQRKACSPAKKNFFRMGPPPGLCLYTMATTWCLHVVGVSRTRWAPEIVLMSNRAAHC